MEKGRRISMAVRPDIRIFQGKAGFSLNVIPTRLVLPDWRGPGMVTTGYSAAHRTGSFAISRMIMAIYYPQAG